MWMDNKFGDPMFDVEFEDDFRQANGTFIFGAVLGAAGGILGGIGKKKAAKAQAKAAEANAQIVGERTELESTLSRRKEIQATGATEAGFGAAGVENTGTVGDILRQSARDAALELGSIQRVGELEQKALRLEAKGARKAGKFGLASGIVRGVGSLFG